MLKSGEMYTKKIFFSDEEIHRLAQMGKVRGQNHRVYAYQSLEQGGAPQSPRARRRQQGRIPIMVALGVGYNGFGGLHLVGGNLEINGGVLMDLVRGVREGRCREVFGVDFSFQQDYAPARCEKEVRGLSSRRMPRTLELWPACSPGLTVLDYTV